ncbi:hypothetical protein M422DRAFT_248133 [Sphaerobolus stellatus SS14]|uniref:Dystroglycan-type cadherin-like domain-containing protein n=1 Tax=Sphaerobolus stellatus (strain SS14) TaxID=990650 RepID=A0A0C9W5Y9_SPHS4|nr:hypothetical protein M422DRAFT_248133 [Sphaerobolus stellatus SS14]
MLSYAVLFTSLSFTILASAASPPSLHRPLKTQLVPSNHAVSSVYFLNSTSAWLVNASRSSPAVRVPPSWSFSIGLRNDTFLPPPGEHAPLTYAARLEDGSELPKWLRFSPTMLTFGGSTPNKPQVLTVVVTASSSAKLMTSDSFTLIISSHDLTVFGPLLTRNVTSGSDFSFVLDDFQGIHVDGSPIKLAPGKSTRYPYEVLLSIKTSIFPWLSYDPKSRTLHGRPPSINNTEATPLPAIVHVTFPEKTLSIATNLSIAIVPSPFKTSVLPELSLHPGDNLTYSLAPFIRPLPYWDISASIEPANATWLFYNTHNYTLNGTVPQNSPSLIKLHFQANDKTHGLHSQVDMQLSIEHPAGTKGSLNHGGKKSVGRTLGIIFGALGGVILITFIFCMYRSRQRRSTKGFKHDDPVEYIAPKNRSALYRAFCALKPRSVSPQPLLPTRRVSPKTTTFMGLFRKKVPTPPRPSLRKSRIGRPIDILQGSTGLLASFVRPKTADNSPIKHDGQHPVVTAGMAKDVDTPISLVSHCAVKGSLEGMKSSAGFEKNVRELPIPPGTLQGGQDSDSDAEPLAKRKVRISGKVEVQHVSSMSTVDQAPVGVPVSRGKRSLPPTPLSRPQGPTPSQMRSNSGMASATAAIATSTLKIPPPSILKRVPGPVSILRSTITGTDTKASPKASLLKPPFARNLTNTLATPHTCYTSSPLRHATPVLASKPDVPSSPFSNHGISPPPSMPLPDLPIAVNTTRHIHFGDSSLESFGGDDRAETPPPRLMQFENSRTNTLSNLCHSPSKYSQKAVPEVFDLADEEWNGNLYSADVPDADGEGASYDSASSSDEYDGVIEGTSPLSIVKKYTHHRAKSTMKPFTVPPSSPATNSSASSQLYIFNYILGEGETFNDKLRIDIPASDVLTAALDDGGELPDWIHFDEPQRSFYGVAPNLEGSEIYHGLHFQIQVINEKWQKVVARCNVSVYGGDGGS